jgi:hypothetical protein
MTLTTRAQRYIDRYDSESAINKDRSEVAEAVVARALTDVRYLVEDIRSRPKTVGSLRAKLRQRPPWKTLYD